MVSDIKIHAYIASRNALRKCQGYKKLAKEMETSLNHGPLKWFQAKDLLEPPLAMLAAHYVARRISGRQEDIDNGFAIRITRNEMLKKEIARFIYELNDEIVNPDENFGFIYEMEGLLKKFEKSNRILVSFKREEAMCGMWNDKNEEKDIVFVKVAVGSLSASVSQSRDWRTLNDIMVIRDSDGDVLYQNEWTRTVSVIDWISRAMTAWCTAWHFSWAIEEEAITAANIPERRRRKNHIKTDGRTMF